MSNKKGYIYIMTKPKHTKKRYIISSTDINRTGRIINMFIPLIK